MTGRFISFEGGEGVGKSTQVPLLAERLRAKGIDVVTTREPGGSAGAEAIRTLLTSGEAERWLPMSELLMFYAARVDHAERLIKPALTDGKWVISDRFYDCTTAYQGYGHGLSLEVMDAVRTLSLGSFKPDLTFIFDMDPEVGMKRYTTRQRFELLDMSFHQRAREGYLAIARAEPERCCVISADQSVESVTNTLVQQAETRLRM